MERGSRGVCFFNTGRMTLYCFRNYIKAVLPGAGKEVKTMKEGKSMLVLGGSYSTFRGCNPEGFYRCFATRKRFCPRRVNHIRLHDIEKESSPGTLRECGKFQGRFAHSFANCEEKNAKLREQPSRCADMSSLFDCLHQFHCCFERKSL